MQTFTLILFGVLDCAAIVCLFRRPLPTAFPWKWALCFVAVLGVGGLMPLGSQADLVCFSALLACVIVGGQLSRLGRWAPWLAMALAVWVLADSVRLVPTPDAVATSGEIWLWGFVRRPYAFFHPNLLAAWSLLLPLGPWTFDTVLFTQSRAALLGLVAMLILRFTPKRYLPWAAGAGLVLMLGALLIRPGTALGRLDFWTEGLRFFLARPLTGWGSGSYALSLATTPAAGQMNAVVHWQRTMMHTAHNALLTVAAENGLPGVVAFSGLAFGVLSVLRRSTHPARWGLLAFWIQQCFDDQWLHPVSVILIGFALAVCLNSLPPKDCG